MLILEEICGEGAVIYRDDEKITVPLENVKCREPGSVLLFREGVYIKDEQATEQRRRDIISLQNSLWE